MNCSGLRESHSPSAPTLCYVNEALSSQEHLKFLGINQADASRAMKCKPCTCMGARALYELIKHDEVQAVSIQQTVIPKLRESFFYDKES